MVGGDLEGAGELDAAAREGDVVDLKCTFSTCLDSSG
jgi:hypothetical protein